MWSCHICWQYVCIVVLDRHLVLLVPGASLVICVGYMWSGVLWCVPGTTSKIPISYGVMGHVCMYFMGHVCIDP